MIEKTILDYLASATGVPVYTEIPAGVPDKYIVIDKTGSTRENRLRSATVAVQSVAGTLYEAAALNETVVSKMVSIADSVSGVYSCELNSDYNFTNTKTKERRYQAVFNIYYKE